MDDLLGDLAVTLETVEVATSVIENQARSSVAVPSDQLIGQPIPRSLGRKDLQMFIGDLRGHPRKVTSLLLFADARRGSFEASLIPDECVVGGASVETEHGASMFAFGMTLFIGITNNGHHRNDQINVTRCTTSFGSTRGNLWNDMSFQVARFTNGMHMHTIGNFAGHMQHPWIHRGDINFGIGCIDLARTPLRCDEGEFIKLSMVFKRCTAKCSETGLDC